MKWISVKERLPEDNTAVLVYVDSGDLFYLKDGHTQIAYFVSEDGYSIWVTRDNSLISSYITHWMPLPNAPE